MLEYNKNNRKKQEVLGIITEMSLIILLPPITVQTALQILSYLNTKAV